MQRTGRDGTFVTVDGVNVPGQQQQVHTPSIFRRMPALSGPGTYWLSFARQGPHQIAVGVGDASWHPKFPQIGQDGDRFG